MSQDPQPNPGTARARKHSGTPQEAQTASSFGALPCAADSFCKESTAYFAAPPNPILPVKPELYSPGYRASGLIQKPRLIISI